ncbi:MAG: SGNH/GDSL hydrolase family protein [Deltaproteobacteria bacterium]|nr:SGNH/GDSL hydrolase family protein [Deltaproteobacteria bacterium]
MQETAHREGESRLVALAFIGGVLTASVIAFAFFVFLGSRIGFQTIWEKTGVSLTGAVLDIPDELIDELTAMNAVIGNAGNPTGAKKHDTIVSRPDDELGWVLRPNVSVDGFQLRARDPVNLDPPVLYLKSGSQMSAALRKYLDENARVFYTYNFDGDGHRRTIPEVDADKKILMVGDSGLFGVGVDDEDTVASNLQRLVGDSHRVVNAGVGGYGGEQAFAAARMLSDREDFDILIYVGHHNDFYEPSHIANPEKARKIIASFESLKNRFPGGIVVALLTYLEYTGADVLRAHGWQRDRIEAADRLRAEFPAISSEAGFPFVDWTDIAEEIREQERTIFSPWALYVDHAHLSVRGNRLFAERIHAAFSDEPSSRRSPPRSGRQST